MKRSGLLTAALVAMLVVLWAPATWAESPFSAGELDRFINDWPGFATMMESEGKALDAQQIPNLAKGMHLNQKLKSYLSGRGWGIERFMYMASHVSVGLASLMMAQQQPKIEAGMSQAKAEIMNNPDIPDEMKQQLLAQLEAGMGQTQQMSQKADDLPQQELDLIAGRLEQIKTAFQIKE
jgi:hypothetical protein